MNRNHENGNAFIFILIAVALFAALAFTFSRGADRGNSNFTKQQAKIAAQELIGFFSQVGRAYDKLRQKGCSVDDISLANSGDSGAFIAINDSATAPLDRSCHVFDPNGGKISFNMDWTNYQVPLNSIPPALQADYDNIYMKYDRIGVSGIGTPSYEITLALNFVSVEICKAYNEIAGIEIDYSIAFSNFGVGEAIYGDVNPGYANKQSFCVFQDGLDYGFTRYVLLAR